ncbi:MAG: delta-60 repeat domain-containing protein [Verrucomicrobiales bacterium]|nr:delta-60 repeat domain-containing protein [Verrucomicrobiales bacterium]
MDGRLLVGTSFGEISGQSRQGLARLNPDGSLDSIYDPAPNGYVQTLVVLPDGDILVGGFFKTIAGQSLAGLARLNPDGTPNQGFSPPGFSSVHSIAVQTDGGILIAGALMDGGVPRRVVRLHSDGSLDLTFDPDLSAEAMSLAIQSDGSLLAGLWGSSDENLVRLNNPTPATQSLGYDGSDIVWLRGGSSPEVWRVTFEYSVDDTEWTLLDTPSRIPGGWELTDVPLPAEGIIRARGYTTGGQYNGSSWFVETLLPLAGPVAPQILMDEASPRFTDHGFGFDVVGTPGDTVVVEVSFDLLEWAEIVTVTLGNEPVPVTDPEAGLTGQRFYRIRPNR